MDSNQPDLSSFKCLWIKRHTYFRHTKFLDVLASNVEEMKEFLKTALDRLETTDLKEEGAGVKKEGKGPSALL